jgi:hypothetical protein
MKQFIEECKPTVCTSGMQKSDKRLRRALLSAPFSPKKRCFITAGPMLPTAAEMPANPND